jgi:hypothetical protein
MKRKTLHDSGGKYLEMHRWTALNMVGMVESQREQDGKTSLEHRYYFGSIANDAKAFAEAVRRHWAVENDLHWSLDISFRENESRIRDRNAAENFAIRARTAETPEQPSLRQGCAPHSYPTP